MLPSLLFSKTRPNGIKIQADLYGEIRLDSLLSAPALSLLALPATAEDILMRQAFFRHLENPAFYRELQAFAASMTALWQTTQQHANAQNDCERLLTFYAMACRFVAAEERALALQIKDECLRHFTEHFNGLRPIITKLQPRTKALEPVLQSIYTSRLIFNPIAVHLQKDEPLGGLLSAVQKHALALEVCSIELPAQRTLAMPHELSATLIDVYPDEFAGIQALYNDFSPLPTEGFFAIRDELHFYFDVFELIERASARKIPHCYPTICSEACFSAKNAYDITLLDKSKDDIVPNDIHFDKEESFYFLTGANGGGKTTYLRTVAANLILASAGCPAFADACTVSPFATIGAHFPVDETTQSGRLIEEQGRANALIESAKDGGFLLFNETFSGTNEKLGLVLTLDCAQACVQQGVFALFVTHFHEVAGHGFPILSTVVDTDQENLRTFKITRDTGLRSSYAEDILRKYRLSADALAQRGGKK